MGATVSLFSSSTPPPIESLAGAASAEGLEFVTRTLDEWNDGTNAFDRPGEAFFLACLDGDAVGMCGLNRDPFLSPDSGVGRLRHLYVRPSLRRQGVGARLVAACLDSGASSFTRIRLRTFDPRADRFYLLMGFVRVDEPEATHSWTIHQ